jgi:type I restriction enzyme S subunit
MSNQWQFTSIGDICTVISGQSPMGKFYNKKGTGLPFYQGKKEFTERFLGEPTTWTTQTTKEALADDILMSVRAPVGPVNISTEKICIGRGLAAIRPSKNILRDFLFYFFIHYQKELVGNAGAVFNSINKTQINKIQIPIPPLPEQQRIVEILDQSFDAIDQAIANTEKNLNNAKDLFESQLNQNDSKKIELGNLVQIRTGRLNANAANEDGIYPFFTCAKEIYKINEFAFDTEAILLAGNNAVGDFNVKHYKGKFNAYQRTYVITINNTDLILYRHLYYQLLKSLKIFKSQSVGANTKFLKLDMIKKLPISLPSLELQNEFVNKLDYLLENSLKLESIYKQKLSALAELKQSILHKAFQGDL